MKTLKHIEHDKILKQQKIILKDCANTIKKKWWLKLVLVINTIILAKKEKEKIFIEKNTWLTTEDLKNIYIRKINVYCTLKKKKLRENGGKNIIHIEHYLKRRKKGEKMKNLIGNIGN